MAITTLTDTNFSALFKRVWGQYGDNLYGTGAEDPVISQLTKTFNFKGSQMDFPIKLGFGGSTAFGTLPTANSGKYATVVLTRKKAYARLNLDRETIIASKGREGAFKEATEEETTSKLRSFMRTQACAFFNDGTGILGQQSGNATGTAAAPVLTALATGTYKFRQAFFEEGDYIQIREDGTTLLSSVWEITAVDTATRAITLARITGSDDLTTIGTGTHDIILQNSLNAAPMGIKGVVEFATGNLYSVAFQRRWKSYGIDSTTGGANPPVSTDYFNKDMLQINNVSGEYPNLIALSVIQMEKLLNRLEDKRRYSEVLSGTNKLASKVRISFPAIAFDSVGGEVKLVSSRYVEDDRIYYINTNKIEQKHAEKFGWFEEDGTVLLRMQDQDAYEARYGGYYENYINPLFQGYRYDLAV